VKVRRGRAASYLVLTLCSALMVALAGATVHANAPQYTPRERLGVGVVTHVEGELSFPSHLSDYAGVKEIGFGWYADWTMRPEPELPDSFEFVQTLSLAPWRYGMPTGRYLEQIRRVTEANPGALWLVGNEPEHPGQGNCTPEEYAHIYHRAYTFLKDADATAQVAIGGIVFPSPLRLLWLERALDAYRINYGAEMPVDVWNTHMQILRENWWDDSPIRYEDGCCVSGAWGAGVPVGFDPYDPEVQVAALGDLTSCDNANVALFAQFVWTFRQWLVDQGQGGKPLIISEYGVLMPNDRLRHGADDVLAFMEGTFAFLYSAAHPELGYPADGGRLVQRWLWFSLNAPLPECAPGGSCTAEYNGALYDWRTPDHLTVFGETFRRLAALYAIDRPHHASVPLVFSERSASP